MKRALIFLAVLALLSGCAGDAATPSPSPSFAFEEPEALGSVEDPVKEGETRIVRLAMVGDAADIEWAKETQDAINALLETRQTALRLEFAIMTWETNRSPGYTILGLKDAVKREDGGPMDLFLYEYGDWLPELVEHNYILDLTDEIGNFPGLMGLTPERAWKESAIAGRTYCFPLLRNSIGSVADRTMLSVRESALREEGGQPPMTPEELLSLALRSERYGVYDESGFPTINLAADSVMPPYALHRSYEEWPFYVDEKSMFVYYADGGMEIYAESPIFDKDTAYLHQWSDKNLLSPLFPSAWAQQMAYYEWFYQTYGENIYAALYPATTYYDAAAREEWVSYQFAPEKENIQMGPCAQFAISVSRHTQSLEDALRMLQFLYADQEINDLLVLGMQDRDWTLQLDGSALVRKTGYHTGERFAHAAAARTASGEAPAAWPTDFPASGFVYRQVTGAANAEPLPVLDLALQDLYNLRMGMPDSPDKDAVIAGLKEAGIDAVMAAYREQYDRFLAQIGFEPPN